MDIGSVVEEVALEGLDGVTLRTLWVRLVDRPDLELEAIDDDLKRFVWRNLTETKEVDFYVLPEARPELVLFKYSSYIDELACSCILPGDLPEDTFSLTVIDQDGIMGACDHFHTRVKVSDEVRTADMQSLLSLPEAEDRWGDRLVIVASQRQRNLVLLDSTLNCYNLTGDIYFLLEKIGRGRYDGELSQCKSIRGLLRKKMKTSVGSLHTRIKRLQQLRLIIKQDFTVAFEGFTKHQTRLLHLKRFYRATPANLKSKLFEVTQYLMSRPNHTAAYTSELVKDLQMLAPPVKKHITIMKKFIKYHMVPYREYYPNAKDKEWKSKNGSEKLIKLVTLIKPFNMFEDLNVDDSDEDEGEEEEGGNSEREESDTEGGDAAESNTREGGAARESQKSAVSEYGYPLYHLSTLSQIKKIIDESGPNGLSLTQLRNRTGLPGPAMNKAIPYLMKEDVIARKNRSYGRTSSTFYMSVKYADKGGQSNPQGLGPADSVEKDEVEAEIEQRILSRVQVEDEELKNVTLEQLDQKITEMNITWKVDRATPPSAPGLTKHKATIDTARKKARKTFVLRCLSLRKVYPKMRFLMDDLFGFEKQKGQKETMCRKSFMKMMSELYKEGHLYYVKAYCNVAPQSTLQHTIVDASVDENDPRLRRALLYIKTDFLRRRFKAAPQRNVQTKKATHAKATPSPKKKSPVAKASSSQDSSTEDQMVSVCDLLDMNAKKKAEDAAQTEKGASKQSGIEFGLLPKFERLRTLHMYMFYLLYGYDDSSVEKEPQGATKSGSPRVYMDVEGWQRYLPPLKRHNSTFVPKKDGVCMVGDLLLHMPLCLYCSVVNVGWKVDGLKEALADPETRLYPLDALPCELLSPLLYRRKYIARIVDSIQTLCQMGVVTFSPKGIKRDYEYLTIYLHKKAMLLNTEMSEPGNLMTRCPAGKTFEKIHYTFRTMEDVDKYWQDLRLYGNNTPLGHYSARDELGDHGEITLLDVCKPKMLDEIREENWLPGDRRGAGGLDSSLFLHRQSNWMFMKNNISTQLKRAKEKAKKALQSSVGRMQSSKSRDTRSPSNEPRVVKGTPRLFSQPVKVGDVADKKGKQKGKKPDSTQRIGSLHKIVKAAKRKLRPSRIPRARRRTAYLDAKDKESKLSMYRIRSRFSPVENGMLLLCQVASWVLCPNSPLMCVNFDTVRDILHTILPEEAKDKTRHSLKGKYNRLSREHKFKATAVHFLTMAKSDEELMAKYDNSTLARTDPEFIELYSNLVVDLLHKFRSQKNIKHFELPESVDKLSELYTVCRSYDLLEEPIQLTTDVDTLEDVHVFVVWELIQSMLHLEGMLPVRLAYNMLSHFDDHVVSRALDLLQQARIITQLKRDQQGHRRYLRSTLPHSKKATRRHKEAVRSKAPVDLLFNVKKQIDDLRAARHGGTGVGQVVGEEKPSAAAGSSAVAEPEPMDTSGGPSTSTTSTPSSSTAACPSRSDGDTQTNDGKKKEWMKLDSDDRWMEMDSVKYQAGSCLALISLLAADKLKTRLWVPDEMVRLDTDSMEQLAQGKLPGRKRRKPPVADSEAPKGKNQIVLTRPAQKKAKLAERNQGLPGSEDSSSEQMSSEPSSSSAGGPAFSARMEDKYEEKAVVTENVDLSYRCLKSDECHFLNDYAVWLASGSLLTLARQAVIDKLDIQSNKFLFHQRFSVDNVYLRFRLREGSTDGLEMLKEWRGVEVEEEPWSLRLGTGHHRLRNTTSEENSKETPTSSAKVASFSTPAGSSSRNAEDSEMEVATSGKISISKTTKSAPSSDDTPTAKRKGHKGRSDLTPTPGEASADKLFKEVIEGLETVFTPEFLKTDVEADIARCLPPGLVEKGRVFVSVVDQFGVRGALDNEIERRMGESVVPLRPLIRRLLKCHAVSSNIVMPCTCVDLLFSPILIRVRVHIGPTSLFCMIGS